MVIPGLNFPALLNGSRTSPIDKGNLNRVFPGKRNGSLTEMIAHYVDTVLFPMADFVFDIHAGGLSTNYLPTVLAYTRSEERRVGKKCASPCQDWGWLNTSKKNTK